MERSRQTLEDRALRTATVVVVACAVSAGAHAGLVPAHLEAEPRLGGAFVVAVGLLAAAAAALALRPRSALAARAAALLLAGLIGAYAASRTTGIPLLSPEPEGIDAVGLTTNAVQALGVVLALQLAQTTDGRRPPINQEPTP